MEHVLQKLLDSADIKLNGGRPWDIKVNNPAFCSRLLAGGSLALGESYMNGWWDCDALDQLFDRILRHSLDKKVKGKARFWWHMMKSKVTNPYRRSKAFEIGKRHYDIGRDVFENMLDRNMVYSCAYWKDAHNLEDAQTAKHDLICRKLHLRPGHRVLDIGCGWGGFARHAAKKYGSKVSGITVSKDQARYCAETCYDLPVNVSLTDYRDIDITYDDIVSVGMFEHVGYRSYRTFMKTVARSLNRDGIFLLHTIGNNRSVKSGDPWVLKYIFPNSMLPSARQIVEASEGLLLLLDWHSFGAYYDRTLMAWYENFNRNWDKLKDKYGQQFYRMWTYYLLSFAGAFRANKMQVWQIVFAKPGSKPGYESVR